MSTRLFNPPEVVSRSRVLSVENAGPHWCVISYLRHDGVMGCSRVDPDHWPADRWPPRAGDTVKVVVRPVVEFEGREVG